MLEEAETLWDKQPAVTGDEGGTPSPLHDATAEGGGLQEQLLTFAAAAGAAVLTRHLLQAGWRKALDREPPKNPAAATVAWQDALLWGAVSGALVGVTRIVSRRASTAAYQRIRR
jgi:hypothetical protein